MKLKFDNLPKAERKSVLKKMEEMTKLRDQLIKDVHLYRNLTNDADFNLNKTLAELEDFCNKYEF